MDDIRKRAKKAGVHLGDFILPPNHPQLIQWTTAFRNAREKELAQWFKKPSRGPTERGSFAVIATKRDEAETEDGTPDKSGPRRMLNEAQVLSIIPVSRTTLYRMEKANRFPRSTYISPNRRIWYEDEIVAWQDAVDEFNPNRGRGKGRTRASS